MKSLKLIAALAIVALFLVIALPIAAEPAGTQDDPFGGPSTRLSGDGSKVTKAIYIGGNDKGDKCWTGLMPAMSTKWFKADKAGKIQVWAYEELAGATKASGRDIGGAAGGYFTGKTNQITGVGLPTGVNLSGILDDDGFQQSVYFGNGFWLKIYDPDSVMGPTYLFPNPQASYFSANPAPLWDLLTTNDGIRADGTLVPWHGWANFNRNAQAGGLWAENKWSRPGRDSTTEGFVWSYYKLYNVMVWNSTATICTN